MCECVCVRVCVFVCVRARARVCVCVCEMVDAQDTIGQPFKGQKGRYSRDKKIPGPKCDLTRADA